MRYDTSTQFALYPIPATPAMPAQNSWYRDMTFSAAGVPILRATDGRTGDGAKAHDFLDMDFSLPANEANPWSPSGTRLLTICGGGNVMPLNFDGANLATSRVACPPGDTSSSWKYGGVITNLHGVKDPTFSRLSDDIVFGSDKRRFVSSYNLVTDEARIIWDTGTIMNNHLYSFSTGHGDDVLAVIGGGTAQDTDYLAAVHSMSSGETHVLNSLDNTIDGQPFEPSMGGKKMHNARVTLCGRYMVIAMAGGGGMPYVWEWRTGTVREFSPNGGGHRYGGYQAILNAAAPPGGGGPSLGFRRGDEPGTVIYVSPEEWSYSGLVADTHQSWANCKPGELPPVFVASYWCSSNPDPYVPGQMAQYPLLNEIYAVSADGTRKFYRFCYARAVGGYTTFFYQPIVHVDPTGRYVAWTSNWDRSLGPNKTGGARVDVFIAKLPVAA